MFSVEGDRGREGSTGENFSCGSSGIKFGVRRKVGTSGEKVERLVGETLSFGLSVNLQHGGGIPGSFR